MGNIKIVRGVFDTKLELEHAGVAAGFPILTDDYSHETLDFNRDYIKHPEASFYGDVEGDSMKDPSARYCTPPSASNTSMITNGVVIP